MYHFRNNIEMEVILVLLHGDDHLRNLSRKIKVPIATLSRTMKKLRDANVSDYRPEGKNKVFFIRKTMNAKIYVYLAEHYKLLKFLANYPKVGTVITNLLKKTNSNVIVLFGSYADFTAGKNSDIDLYLETSPEELKKIEETDARIHAKRGKLDLSSDLGKEIMKKHIILRGVEEFYENTRILG